MQPSVLPYLVAEQPFLMAAPAGKAVLPASLPSAPAGQDVLPDALVKQSVLLAAMAGHPVLLASLPDQSIVLAAQAAQSVLQSLVAEQLFLMAAPAKQAVLPASQPSAPTVQDVLPDALTKHSSVIPTVLAGHPVLPASLPDQSIV
jgi:hypothetical protein